MCFVAVLVGALVNRCFARSMDGVHYRSICSKQDACTLFPCLLLFCYCYCFFRVIVLVVVVVVVCVFGDNVEMALYDKF